MKPSRSSLIISTYNWPEALELCLKSVLQQSVLPGEVIIADDGSDKRTEELILQFRRSFPIPLKHIWHEDKGFRKTLILNKAVSITEGDYIIQIDGDVILDRNFMKDHQTVAEAGFFIRGTRGRFNAKATKELLSKGLKPRYFFSAGLTNRFNALRIPFIGHHISKKSASGRSVRGSNLAFWKEDFIRINGYNNDFCGWGHEDEELAWRFVNSGTHKKVVKLCAVQFHLHHKEASQENEPSQRNHINVIIEKRAKNCANGFAQVSINDNNP